MSAEIHQYFLSTTVKDAQALMQAAARAGVSAGVVGMMLAVFLRDDTDYEAYKVFQQEMSKVRYNIERRTNPQFDASERVRSTLHHRGVQAAVAAGFEAGLSEETIHMIICVEKFCGLPKTTKE